MGPVNEADLETVETEHGETHFRRTKLAEPAGGEDLGCSRYELPSGARSWPFHYHAGNAEAIYVLSGSGTIRLADGEHPLESGDYVALSRGPDGAHGVRNDGEVPLCFLVVSEMRTPDVTVYPDSDKLGVYAGAPPGSSEERDVEGYYLIDDDVDYWTGE